MQVNIRGDERASLSFQVMVSLSAAVGSSYTLTVYLLGGVNTAGGSETAFATLTVTGSAGGSGPVDNREAGPDVTPRLIRVAPGGSALYMILPVFWGDWSADLPEYTVEVRLPSGVTPAADAICGPKQSTIPDQAGCDIDVAEGRDGSTVITAHPGFTSGESNGLYLTLAFDPALSIDTKLQLHTFMRVSGDVPSGAAGGYQGVNAVVVDPSEIASSGDSGAVFARLEMTSNFSRQGDTCTKDSTYGDTDLVLYEWGKTAELGRIDVPSGRIGSVSTGTGAEVCIIDVRFEDVPDLSVYQVALFAEGDLVPCRTCVLSVITPSQEAEQVFER